MKEIIPIRALKDNYIWLIRDNTLAWVVDPGDAGPVTNYLREHELDLAGILVTHHHADHSGGIAGLLNEWGSVPVYGSIHSKVPHVSHFVKEGDKVTCGNLVLKVAEIPGHTLDHTAFFNDEMIFSGDTLFSAGCGRVFEGTHEQMHQSLTKIFNMSDSAKIYCGHEYTQQNLRFAEHVEPENLDIQKKIEMVNQLTSEGKPTLPSLLCEEKKINPFLRCEEKTVIQAAQNYANNSLSQPDQVFKSLREWKNNF